MWHGIKVPYSTPGPGYARSLVPSGWR